MDAEPLTCVAAVGPQLWHLNPFIGEWIVPLTAAQLIRMSIRTSNDVQLTLREASDAVTWGRFVTSTDLSVGFRMK